MAQAALKALMIGDVIGTPGMKALFAGSVPLVRSTKADIVVANEKTPKAASASERTRRTGSSPWASTS